MNFSGSIFLEFSADNNFISLTELSLPSPFFSEIECISKPSDTSDRVMPLFLKCLIRDMTSSDLPSDADKVSGKV